VLGERWVVAEQHLHRIAQRVAVEGFQHYADAPSLRAGAEKARAGTLLAQPSKL
jgi:hypothetical protein